MSNVWLNIWDPAMPEVDISSWDHIPPWVHKPRHSVTPEAHGIYAALLRGEVTPAKKYYPSIIYNQVKNSLHELMVCFCCRNKESSSKRWEIWEPASQLGDRRRLWVTECVCRRTLSLFALSVNKNKPTTITGNALCARDHDDVNYSLLAPKRTLSDRGLLVTLGAWVHASGCSTGMS